VGVRQDVAADQGTDVAAVLRLLATAPPEVRAWLAEHATDLGGADEPAAGPATAPTLPAPATDDVDPTAHEDDEDDILVRRAPAGPRRRGGSLRLLVVVALAVGAVVGVWLAGRPAGAGPDETAPTMRADVSDAEATARIAALEARLATDRDDVAAHLELGVLLFNAERVRSAGEHWEAATRLAPDGAEAWYNLGFYHASVEPPDYAAARRCWERVVEIDPGSELARVATMHLGGVLDDDAADGAVVDDGGAG
jgi:tetratricopeptide (TPR) repeat protein